MSPDPDEHFTFHYEILRGFRASSSTHSGHFGGEFLLWGMLVVVVVVETDTGVNKKQLLSRYGKPYPQVSIVRLLNIRSCFRV